ncbi:MAG: hemerythrin domain-containing protein [Polyangiales bacterium]
MAAIYEELKTDHQKVLSLLDDLIASEKAGPEVWGRLVEQVRDELVPHARAEEAILYNALREDDRAKGLIAHSYNEHLEAEAALRGLQVGEAANVAWVSVARKLRDSLRHHIQEEETKVFPAAERVFSAEEAAAMGSAFVQMKPGIRADSFAGNTLDMIVNLLPARLRESVRKFANDNVGGRRAARA